MCAKDFTAVFSKVSFGFSDLLTLGFTNVHTYTNEVMIRNNAWDYITVAYNIWHVSYNYIKEGRGGGSYFSWFVYDLC